MLKHLNGRIGLNIRSIINKLRGHTDVPTLIKKGLTVGDNVFINFHCIIDESFCWLISIGNNVTLAPNVHILAHDASTKRELGYTKIGAVNIGDYVFIGAGTIILPGVTIGNKVVIGAGSVVTKDIPGNSVAVGNPAKVICTYDEYMDKHRKVLISQEKLFSRNPAKKDQVEIKKYLSTNRKGFIE